MKKTSFPKKDAGRIKEQELIDWKHRFELVAEASGQIVYDYNLNDGSIKWSGSTLNVLGYKLSEMNGGIKQWEKLIHKDDRKEALRLLEIAEKDLTPYEIEYRFRHKNGNYLEIKDTGYFIPDENGRSIRMVGMMKDISSQKRSRLLITALNTAVLEMQKVFSKEDIYKVIAREFKKMNIESMVSLVDAERKNIFFEYFSYDSKLVKVAEKIAGLSAKNLTLSIDKIKEYGEVINHKKTLLIESNPEFIRQILPKKVKFMAEQVIKMFKINRFIIAPLIADDRVFGIFSVQSEDLIESDIPAVTIFAYQLAGAWQKGELIEKIRQDVKVQIQAEEALKASEQKARTIIEQLSEGFALIDEKGKIVEWNDAMEKISGRKKKDAIGLFFWEMQYEHTLPELRGPEKFNHSDKVFLESLKKKDSAKFNKTFEVPFLNLKGEKRIIQSTIFPIFLGEKFFVGNVTRDITEQKRTDEILHRSEERFSKVFKSSPYAISISDLETGRYIDVNDNFLKLIGFNKDEIIGKNSFELNLWINSANRENITGRLRQENSIKNILTDFRIKSGEIRTWKSSLEIIELNEKPCILSMIEDITDQKKAEDLLKESNRKLNTLINNLSGVVYRCLNDKDWTMGFISDGIKELSGFPPEEFIFNKVRTFDSIIEPEDKNMAWNSIQNALDNNTSFAIEYRINCSNGEQKWVSERGSGIYEKDKLIALEGYISDITASRYTAQVIKESEETLKTFINALPEPAFLIDKNYNILLSNKSLADSFNLSPEKMTGKNIFKILPQEDAGRRSKYIDEVLMKEEPIIFEDSRDDLFYINYLYPVFDEGKKVSKVAIFALDITSRLKAEKENLLLAQTLKSVKDAISITDMNNNVIFVNDAFLETYGFPEEEIIEKNISFVNPKGFKDDSGKIHEETMKGGYHGEIMNIKKDGREFPVELWTSTVRDSNNNIIATVGVARDITSRLKAEKENTLLAQTIKSVKDAISITDMDNNLLFVNDAFLETYGYNRDEIIGKHVSVIVSEKNPKEILNEIQIGTKKGSWNGELIDKRKDGTEFPIELWTSVIKDIHNNTNVGMVGIARDITERKQAEKEIEETNKKLIQAQRVARIGSWEDYLPTGELFWSSEMYIILGIDRGVKLNFSDTTKLFPPEELEKLNAAVNDAIINKKPYSMDYKIITPDGNVKYIHDEGEVRYDESGNAEWMYGTTQDITENKLAEIALKESEEKMQSIFRVAPAGIGITKDRIFLDVNLHICEMTGYSKEELTGKSAELLYQSKEDFNYVGNENYRQIKKTGLGFVETNWKKKNGSIINIILSWTPIDTNDDSKGVIFTALDITLRKQYEENLRKSEERFKQVAESADEWIWEVNADGLYTYTSPIVEKILGYKPEEIVNKKHFYDFFLPDVRDNIKKAALEIFSRKEKIKSLINENLHKNGKITILETNGVPMLDGQGNLLGYRGVDKDITERKRAEEELIKAKERAEEMNRVKTNFLANMSHEVRTPLVAILGFSEVLSGIIKEEELKNYVNMIHTGGERLLDTLNLILDLSVIESQKIKIELIPLNIIEEVNLVAALFEKTALRKKLKIDIKSEFESYIINLDAKILRQILNNLINNAIKYTNAGKITVKLNEEKTEGGKFFAVRIEDTGIGIPENKRDLIWEEFRQVSEGLNRSFEGAGLGLSITKKFVEKLGGKIFLEKSEVEVGSTFTVLFPINEETDIKFAKETNREITKKIIIKSKPEILYIEDDPIAIDIVRTFIRDSYNVDGVLTGLEGIEKARIKKYDAVFMDINLGKEMDGLEATKIIREIPGYQSIPIVAITAFAMVGDKEEFFEKGCTHYISKPFTKAEFRQSVSEILPAKK